MTTLNPPQLLRISSDPSERYSLLDNATWNQHLAWLAQQTFLHAGQVQGSIPSLNDLQKFDYYAEALSPLLATNPTNYCPAILNGSINATTIPSTAGEADGGYSGTSLSDPTLPEAQLLNECVHKCCGDSTCAATTLQMYSLNEGSPPGSCKIGEPCCWLIDAASVKKPAMPRPNATTSYVRSGPTPDVPVVPTDPTGQYTALLKHFEQAIAVQMQNMHRETIPEGATGDLSPCCGSGERDEFGNEICTCGYPGRLGTRGSLGLDASGKMRSLFI